MSKALTKSEPTFDLERLVVGGDISQLGSEAKAAYYVKVCESMGLNPITKPLEFIRLNGKETLYARKDCTDQLRKLHSVAIVIAAREKVDDVYVVTARATLPNGRTDESVGAVPVNGLKGDALANAFMKAETKAKRRVTLSIVGLGILDELELETIPQAAFDKPGWKDLPAKIHTTTPEEPQIDLDNDEPPDARKCTELPKFCENHPKLKDYMGIPFEDYPMPALNAVGDVMKKGLEKSEGNKRKWYEWIVHGLLEELAERAAMDGEPAPKTI